MTRHARQRWAIFVHDPEGDSGYGRIVGPFLTAEAAEEAAEKIRRVSEANIYLPDAECIVLPVLPGATGALRVVEALA